MKPNPPTLLALATLTALGAGSFIAYQVAHPTVIPAALAAPVAPANPTIIVVMGPDATPTSTTPQAPAAPKASTAAQVAAAKRPASHPRHSSGQNWACDLSPDLIVICEGHPPAIVGPYMTPAQYQAYEAQLARDLARRPAPAPAPQVNQVQNNVDNSVHQVNQVQNSVDNSVTDNSVQVVDAHTDVRVNSPAPTPTPTPPYQAKGEPERAAGGEKVSTGDAKNEPEQAAGGEKASTDDAKDSPKDSLKD